MSEYGLVSTIDNGRMVRIDTTLQPQKALYVYKVDWKEPASRRKYSSKIAGEIETDSRMA